MPDKEKSDVRNLIGTTAERTFTIERSAVNAADRTVPLAFSSETPVEQWNWDVGRYLEILDHSPGACDLSRLNDGAAVLVNHNVDDQPGSVVRSSATIDGDRVGRCTAQFSQSERGKEIQQDVVDDIRSKVSVRYVVNKIELVTRNLEGLDTYRVTSWTPLEVSFVAIPADNSVGVGRSREDVAELKRHAAALGLELVEPAGTNVRTVTPSAEIPAAPTVPAITTQPNPQERTAMPETVTPTNPTVPAPNADVIRMQDIAAIGELAGQREFALDLALQGKTVDEARSAIMEKRAAAQAANKPAQEKPEDVAARNGGELARVTPRVRLKNFKTQEDAVRFGNFIAGSVFKIPSARQWCKENLRAHSESDNETGGIWVPTEISDTIIDLRENFGLIRQFADVVPMTSDHKVTRRRKGGLTAHPAGAKGTSRKVAESTMKWDAVELIARKWKVTTKLEEELTQDAIIAYADKLVGEMAYAFAVAEDDAFFNADGTSGYHGIVGMRESLKNLSGTIANIAGLVVGAGNAYSELTMKNFTDLVALLPQYADNPNTAFYCHRAFFWNVMVPLMLAAGGVTAKEIQDAKIKQFLGYPVRISQSLPRTEANSQVCLLLGDISLGATFGDRQGIVTKQTDTNDDDWDNDLISMKSIERFDINVHDVGNASATAALRVPGPIVGLITAAS